MEEAASCRFTNVQSSPPMPAIITPERPDTPDATALIAELEAYLEPLYPRESRHGYSVEKLIAEGVAFFLIRDGGAPAGCGGIKLFGTEYGEVKRMYVRPQFRGRGFAKLMLNHLADHARSQWVRILRLETGIHQHAAIRLYEREGLQAYSAVWAIPGRPGQPVLRKTHSVKAAP